MRERVTVIYGKKPFLLVAPHGADGDDINTAIIAEETALALGCNAVINRGFERSDNVDVDDDQANCNRVDHIIQPVVYDEFLKPIIKIKDKLNSKVNADDRKKIINDVADYFDTYYPDGFPGE